MSDEGSNSHGEEETNNDSCIDEADEAARSRREFCNSILGSVDTYMESKNSLFEKKMERFVEKRTDATVKKAAKKIKNETPEINRPGCKEMQYAKQSLKKPLMTYKKVRKRS